MQWNILYVPMNKYDILFCYIFRLHPVKLKSKSNRQMFKSSIKASKISSAKNKRQATNSGSFLNGINNVKYQYLIYIVFITNILIIYWYNFITSYVRAVAPICSESSIAFWIALKLIPSTSSVPHTSRIRWIYDLSMSLWK